MFPARYPGKCASCGQPFDVDDTVGYFDDELMDEGCLQAALEGQRRVSAGTKETTTCPVCFQARAANGSCGCDS